MNKITFILILQLTTLALFSQDKLSRFTYSIVDTTKAQIGQAEEIYQWITNNISYDTKQLIKGHKSPNPTQTIKQKKAVCYGYSQLFHSMCEVLEMESYIILGNTKGFGYVRGENFLKSDHAWNIIFADSAWIIVDATWGSGYLSYEYNLKNKIKRVFNKNSGLKSNVAFNKQVLVKYFNISPNEISKTHFPIDSKWQLKEYPISYSSFICDSTLNYKLLNFKKEIAKVRYQGLSSQLFMDALNSIHYNPFNKFDIAHEYYNQASQWSINKKAVLDSTFLGTLERSKSYYDSSLVYLALYKLERRNLYQQKKHYQRSAQRSAGLTIKKVSKIPTTYDNRYSRAQNKLLKNEMVLKKWRQRIYNSNINVALQNDFNFDTISTPDSVRINEYSQKIEEYLLKLPKYFKQLAELADSIETYQNSGKNNNDTVLLWLRNTSNNINGIELSIDQMDEYEVIQYSKRLFHTHDNYLRAFNSKKRLEARIINEYNYFMRKFESVERTLYSLINYYTKLAKMTGDNNTYAQKANDAYDQLRELYERTLSVISIVKLHNDSWKELVSKQNNVLSIFGSSGLTAASSKTNEFFDYLKTQNTKSYSNDIKIYDSIKSDSRKNVSRVKAAIREIK